MRPKHRKGQHQFQKQLVPVYAHNIASVRKEELTTRSNERTESPNIYESSSKAEGKGYEFSAITNKILKDSANGIIIPHLNHTAEDDDVASNYTQKTYGDPRYDNNLLLRKQFVYKSARDILEVEEDYFPQLNRIGVGQITNCRKPVEKARDKLAHLDIGMYAGKPKVTPDDSLKYSVAYHHTSINQRLLPRDDLPTTG